MLDKQTVDMFHGNHQKFDFFSIKSIILKKASFIIFINQSKKCINFLDIFLHDLHFTLMIWMYAHS